MQAPVSAHSSRTAATPAVGRHPDCWGLSLGPRHPSIRSPAVLLYNYYYAIIVHSVRLPTGSAGCWRRADRGWLGLALGWFASCELSSGQGDGRGAALQRVGGRSPPGEPARAAGPQRPPPSSSSVEVWLDSPRVPSQHVTLGGCALGGDRRMRPVWRASRDGSGRLAVSPPPTSWSSRLAVGPPHLRVHVCARVPTPGGACMYVLLCLCACVCTCVRAGSRRGPRGQLCGAPGREGTVWEGRPPGFAQANQPQPLPPDSWGRGRGKSTDLAPRWASVVQAPRIRRWLSGRAAPPHPRVSESRWLRTDESGQSLKSNSLRDTGT